MRLTRTSRKVRRLLKILRPTLPGETAAGTVASESAMVPHVQAAPMRILHLSDLHFDKDDDPLARLQPLLRDIRDRDGGLGFDHLDYLILSGDLTNHGSAEEFDGVYRFVSELIKRFELSAGRCVIVPGNHDLSWETEVYDWHPKRRVVLNTLKPGSYVAQGDGYLIRDESAYPKRFENFGRFYHELIQLPYPLQPAAQCVPILFDDTRLQFLALNSAWEIDEYHASREHQPERPGRWLARGCGADRQSQTRRAYGTGRATCCASPSGIIRSRATRRSAMTLFWNNCGKST